MCVNILEAQKLVGVNINPAVFVRVGNQKKNTQTQKSTNCPFYNEVQHSPSQFAAADSTGHSSETLTSFCFIPNRRTSSLSFRSIRRSSSIKSSKLRSISLFVFFLPALRLHFHCLRKGSHVSWPPAQVFHRRSLAFLMSHIGTFKIDIATVYKQPGALHCTYCTFQEQKRCAASPIDLLRYISRPPLPQEVGSPH